MVVWVVLSVWLCGCTPSQKLNRLIGNHPELAQTQVQEKTITVYETDTINVPEVSIDTVFNFCTDTVFYAKQGALELSISKQGKGYKVLSKSQAFQIIKRDTVLATVLDTVNIFTVQPISSSTIWWYREQGASWLLILIVLCIAAYYAVRFYLKGQIPIW